MRKQWVKGNVVSRLRWERGRGFFTPLVQLYLQELQLSCWVWCPSRESSV